MDDLTIVPITQKERTPEEVLAIAESLMDVEWQELLIIGFNDEGELCEAYTSSTSRDRLWMVEQYKQFLLEG